MAGLQNCCRKLLIYNSSRLINKNAIVLQPCRGRHHLVFQVPSPQNRFVFQKTKLLFNTNMQQLIYRLASTNVNIMKGIDINTSKPEIAEIQHAPETSETARTSTETVKSEAQVVQSSDSNIIIDESSLPPVPIAEINEPPDLEFISMGLKEPSFESIGLGSWWPSGIMQSVFEYLHVNLDMPWWQAIVLVTLATRILLFPVAVSVRKDVINCSNYLPILGKLQQKITEAKTNGDYYAVATTANELNEFMREKKINPFSFLKTAVIQGPIFISMFYALKGMSGVPVESLKTGGLFWFTDLTVTDPYYLLPIFLSATLFLVIELGAEGSSPQASTHIVKWLLRGVPVIVLLVSTRFSSCITWYWTVSNLISLGQVGLFKIPAVGRFLKFPKAIKHDPSLLNSNNKGFIEGFKEGFRNAKLTGQLQDRERINAMTFEKAGSGAIPRTFKKNPLLQKEGK